jgi:hypothetical protein
MEVLVATVEQVETEVVGLQALESISQETLHSVVLLTPKVGTEETEEVGQRQALEAQEGTVQAST